MQENAVAVEKRTAERGDDQEGGIVGLSIGQMRGFNNSWYGKSNFSTYGTGWQRTGRFRIETLSISSATVGNFWRGRVGERADTRERWHQKQCCGRSRVLAHVNR
jgi:hypothetical protein